MPTCTLPGSLVPSGDGPPTVAGRYQRVADLDVQHWRPYYTHASPMDIAWNFLFSLGAFPMHIVYPARQSRDWGEEMCQWLEERNITVSSRDDIGLMSYAGPIPRGDDE